MTKEEFEEIAGRKVGKKAFEKIERVWLGFISLSAEEVAAMFFSANSETRAIFDEGYALVRELDILHHASAQMRKAGLENSRDDLFEYCCAKQYAYEEKVHAANLGERLQKVEEQR